MTIAQQSDLFETAPRVVHGASRGTLQERFEEFHQNNPWVYRALVRLAREQTQKGYEKVGIKALFEVLRWHYRMQTTDASDFKLNNNYTSRYARLIQGQEPDLADVFELRELHTA